MATIAALSKNPTFRAKVGIPQAGVEPDVEFGFTFKYRTKKELEAFDVDISGKSDAVVILEMVEAWDFEEPLNLESVELLLQKSIASGVAIHRKYKAELVKVKLGN